MVLYLKSAINAFELNKLIQAPVEIPFYTFNKMCFAYLNNDWILTVSSMCTLTLTITLFIVNSTIHLLRSES